MICKGDMFQTVVVADAEIRLSWSIATLWLLLAAICEFQLKLAVIVTESLKFEPSVIVKFELEKPAFVTGSVPPLALSVPPLSPL